MISWLNVMSQSAKCPTFFLTHPVHFSLLSLDVLKILKKITDICYHKNINFSKEQTVIHLLSSSVVQSEYCRIQHTFGKNLFTET